MQQNPPKKNWLFFAYGANMNPEQMRKRCHNPEVIGIAKLDQHKLGFYGHSKVWDGGQTTVVPCPGQCVWGVVYNISKGDWDRLDSWQDVRLDGTGAYFHYPETVYGPHNEAYSVILYKKSCLGEETSPSEEFRSFIAMGAAFHHIPASALAQLQNVPVKQATYPVPKRGTFDRSLLVEMNCSGCGS